MPAVSFALSVLVNDVGIGRHKEAIVWQQPRSLLGKLLRERLYEGLQTRLENEQRDGRGNVGLGHVKPG